MNEEQTEEQETVFVVSYRLIDFYKPLAEPDVYISIDLAINNLEARGYKPFDGKKGVYYKGQSLGVTAEYAIISERTLQN